MVDLAKDLGKGAFFPHLIIKLRKRAGVPIERMDETMNPSRKLLGDDLFKKFFLLHPKQKEERRKRGFQEDDDQYSRVV
ncbi:hypothetical protein PVK06_030657 [Gossypium arboreum]|uniref:Uncharacterized protein n=1 Tax=Gossypium arboreum TaxID=29729 RepID=A0ABR0NR75_GOSAR|nr:hypothetical protein PVK06_030657 [Gossypium arboreum]